MKRGLRRQVAAIGAATILLAIVAFGVLLVTIHALEGATSTARQHERVAADAQRIGALTVDAETAVRGFVITDRDQFLAPLTNAERELPVLSARIQAQARGAEERQLASDLTAHAASYLTDYALPTIDIVRSNRSQGIDLVTSEEGKRRVDAIRGDVGGLVAVADRAAQASQRSATDRGDGARIAAILAGAILALILVLVLRMLQRRVIAPVVEATKASARIGAGDFAVRLPQGRDDEIGELAAGINSMAAHLQESAVELEAQHTELESQNAELEAQSVELEAQAAELERRSLALASANDGLQHRAEELQVIGDELELTSDRLALYAHVAESLAQVPDVENRAVRLLAHLADASDCPIGAVYARTAEHDDECRLVARRGLADAPTSVREAGDLPLRALEERRAVVVSHAEGSLTFESLGERIPVRHEIHLPLLAGPTRERVLGVLSLGRTDNRPFVDGELEMLRHLVDNAALAFFNGLVSAQRERQAAMMRAVLDSVSEAILVVDEEDQIVVSNPPMDAFARRLLGLRPDEPWSPAQVREAVAATVAEREAHAPGLQLNVTDPFAIDARVMEFPALDMWVHRYAGPVRHGERVLGRIVVVRDITEERQAERAKDDLMATVSHELRTPLAAILGFTELLATREFPDEERQEYLDTVYQQSVRLSQLLDDFLDLQRIERRGLDRTMPVDLRDVIDEEVKLYSAQSTAHQLSAALPVADQALMVDGDGERLRRVVGNLLSNAIKYSPAGGPVRIEAQHDNGDIRVAVVDRGLGIPEAARTRVFDRFFRVDSGATARIGGTGLGLSLVRDIVRAHGGDVGVESVEGQGSRFWFTLPAAR